MADGATPPLDVRFTLARRDLDARGAPWVVVDSAHPDDVGDLYELVVGTGHPVLWRVGTPERVEGWCCTGPWELTPEVDALGYHTVQSRREWSPPSHFTSRLPFGARIVAAAEVARVMAHHAPAESRDAFRGVDERLSSDIEGMNVAVIYAASVAREVAEGARQSLPWERLLRGRSAARLIAAVLDGASEGSDLLAPGNWPGLAGVAGLLNRVPPHGRVDPQRPRALTDTRAVILRALGVPR